MLVFRFEDGDDLLPEALEAELVIIIKSFEERELDLLLRSATVLRDTIVLLALRDALLPLLFILRVDDELDWISFRNSIYSVLLV